MEQDIRVRFAPSPTGPLHIGGVRTALFNYLFAKKNKGKLILRIEDTDQNRFVPGSIKYLKETFKWLNIDFDEEEGKGKFGPYVQSKRSHIYQKYILKLLKDNKAYYAFDTPQEIDKMREKLKAARIPNPQYNYLSRETMQNSLTLAPEIVKKKIQNKEPYVIRILTPRNQEIKFYDKIRGYISVNSSNLDDKVLIKSDGLPTYHFANVVDDHLMNISHVIRGEEWLPSTPIHYLIYEYMGWEPPIFAHLPLILKPNGNGKLSKRDADKEGYPVFPIDWVNPQTKEKFEGFREQGYLPQTVINFLALLGWNPGNKKEIYSIQELCKEFSLERVNKSGIKFDIDKAKWYNQQYIKSKSSLELSTFLKDKIQIDKTLFNDRKIEKICSLIKDRLFFLDDLIKESRFFFEEDIAYPKELFEKANGQILNIIKNFNEQLPKIKDKSPKDIKNLLFSLITTTDFKIGKIMPILRMIITGKKSGPDLMEVISLLDINIINYRIGKYIDIYTAKKP